MARLHMPSVAYACTNLSSTMMHSVFMFYYVKVFLDRYHVSESWFQFSQVLYMIWNAVNDPLFGYIQDRYSFSWMTSRRHTILYGAPIFAGSFLVPWFPWADYSLPENGWICGLHLLFALCFYDTLFTFVLLAHCALFPEMSKNQEDRLRFVWYSQVAVLCGSSSVFLCETISNNFDNYTMFQVTCVFIAVASWWFLHYTGLNAHTEYDLQNKRYSNAASSNADGNVTPAAKIPEDSMWRLMWQIMKERDFISCVLMLLCQYYHSVYLSNFTRILCDHLVPHSALSSSARSVFFGSTLVLPQVLVILGASVVSKFGYYRIIKWSFILKIGWGLSMYNMGRQHQYLFLTFLLLESISVNGIFSFFPICMSDIIDKDMQRHRRKSPVSSMVFGTSALITKPSLSIAPMFAVWLFKKHGYDKLGAMSTSSTAEMRDVIIKTTPISGVGLSGLHDVMFNLTTLTPVVVGCLQMALWSFYTIRDSHKTNVKYIDV